MYMTSLIHNKYIKPIKINFSRKLKLRMASNIIFIFTITNYHRFLFKLIIINSYIHEDGIILELAKRDTVQKKCV